MNKKKVACFALASALVIPGAVGLAGCEKGHTHAFNSDPYYEVVLDGEEKIARSWRECSCGAEDAHKEVDNAVIVSADETAENYAQKILDGDINNKTIVFDEGTYTNNLHLRPTKTTAKIYNKVDDSFTLGTEVTGTLANDQMYIYQRSLNNITLAGTKKAIFKGIFMIESRNHWHTGYYDAVKEQYVSDVGYFAAQLFVDKLTLTGLNCEGEYGRVFIWNENYTNSTFDNISVLNSSFITESSCKDNPMTLAVETDYNSMHCSAVVVQTGSAKQTSNFNFKNNVVENHFQGVHVTNANNAEILNNKFKGTVHNSIAVQSSDASSFFSGNINVKNNEIVDATNISIKLNIAKNATIAIENNKIINTVKYSNDWPYLFQLGEMANCSYKLANNTLNGTNVALLEADLGDHDWFYIFIPGYIKTTGQS